MPLTEVEQFWSDWYEKKLKHDPPNAALEASKLAQYILSLLPDGYNAANAEVMEIGCFDGTLTRALAQHFYRVLGTDVCRLAIEKAAARTSEKNVSFAVHSPAWPLNGHDPVRFDVIVVANMFQFVDPDQYDAFLDGVVKHMKPESILLFIGLPESWFYEPFFARRLASDKVRDELRRVFQLTHTFTKDSIAKLLAKHGLESSPRKMPLAIQTDETANLFDVVARPKLVYKEIIEIVDPQRGRKGLIASLWGRVFGRS